MGSRIELGTRDLARTGGGAVSSVSGGHSAGGRPACLAFVGALVARLRPGTALKPAGALLAAVAVLLFSAAPASADIITVTSSGSAISTEDGGCGFLEAVQAANTNLDVNECTRVTAPGMDEIHFNVTVDFLGRPAGPPPYIYGAGGAAIVISEQVKIDGLTQGNMSCPLPDGALRIGVVTAHENTVGGIELTSAASGSIIRGIAFTGEDTAVNFRTGLRVNGGSGHTITCSSFGLTPGVASSTFNVLGGGIVLTNGASSITIGGLNPGEGNLFSYMRVGVTMNGNNSSTVGNVFRNNGANGVTVGLGSGTPVGNLISRNTFQNNSRFIVGSPVPAIDLTHDGIGIVSPNDAGDVDGGANNGQNYPVVASALSNGTNTAVSGTLDSQAGAYTLEFFSSAACSPVGYGEGEVYLGSSTVTIDGGNPTGAFSITTLPVVATGRQLTVTATSSANNTSEFSLCREVNEAPLAGPTLTVNTTDDLDDGVCGALHCSLREAIALANSQAGENAIHFNIAGGTTQVIAVESVLPSITDKVTLDGLTQGNLAGCPTAGGGLRIEIRNTASAFNGLSLAAGSSDSTVRGLSITGFTNQGLTVSAGDGQRFTCNYIGVQADGITPRANANGVFWDADGIVFGGPNPGEGNIVAHNSNVAVSIVSSNSRIERNVIRDNGNDGVNVNSGTGNTITQNSITRNGTTATHVGIELRGINGIDPNDTVDGDAGSNNLQNFPVLLAAATNGTTTSVFGTVPSAPGTYTVEFFGNAACDPSGNGEGEFYLGSGTVTVDAGNPTGLFRIGNLDRSPAGGWITATATRTVAPFDTSEFSTCHFVQQAGVTVVQSNNFTQVTEGGATDAFTIVLTAAPFANVNVAFGTDGQLQPIADAVFTSAPGSWGTAKSIPVAAVDDLVAEGGHTGSISFTVTSTDPVYNGMIVTSMTSQIVDNDTAGIIVNPTLGLTTTESGGTATFTVKLGSQPTQPVTIALTSSDITEGTVSPASLTFAAAASAMTEQTVTVTGASDALVDGNQAYSIVTVPATSADPAYNGLNAPDVAVQNQDATGLSVLSIAAAQANERTGPTTPISFTVTLSPASVQQVSVNWQLVDGTAAFLSDFVPGLNSGVLTFEPGQTSKNITFQIMGDATSEPNETFTVRLVSATDATIGVTEATGTILDDDVRVSACDPRPDVVLTTTRTGADQLIVTVKAGQGTIQRIRFGAAGNPIRNATVETFSPATTIRDIGVFTPPAGHAQHSFLVRRTTPIQPVMVPIVVEDGCGAWETFVGAGRTAF